MTNRLILKYYLLNRNLNADKCIGDSCDGQCFTEITPTPTPTTETTPTPTPTPTIETTTTPTPYPWYFY